MEFKKIFSLFSGALLFFAFFRNASAQDYVPLVSIPGVEEGSVTLSNYLSSVFSIGIALAGVLAVVVLVIAGIEYVGGAASPSAQQDAKERIWGAILGLLLALGTWLFLSTINSDIPSGVLGIAPTGSTIGLAGGPTTSAYIDSLNTDELSLKQDIEAIDKRLDELANLPTLTPEQEQEQAALIAERQEKNGELAEVLESKEALREDLQCPQYFESTILPCSSGGYRVDDYYCERDGVEVGILDRCCAYSAPYGPSGCDNTPPE